MGIFNKFKDALSSTKNFEYLDNLIHSGQKEIKLEHNINLDYDEIDGYGEGVLLDVDDLVIDGNGHTINARGETRIFSVTGENITIKNITLKNGCATKGEGDLTTQNGMFKDKHLSEKNQRLYNYNIEYGGAIFNKGILKIVDSTLTQNTAKKDGGAIFNKGILKIVDCTLTQNTSEENGGAIWGNCDIDNSILQENTAKKDGGAIHNDDGNLTIKNTTLIQNTAKENGGAIWGNCDIDDSILQENTAKKDGGAIHNTKSVKISDSKIINNKANMGGAIYNMGAVKIFNSEIINHESISIIYNTGIRSAILIDNTIIKHNHAKNIIVNENDLSINVCEIIDNKIKNSTIYNEGKNCTIIKTKFANNMSKNSNSTNIDNRNNLIIKNPKIKETTNKSISNKGTITISPLTLEKIIDNEGFIDDPNFNQKDNNFTKLNEIIQNNSKRIILEHDYTLEKYERDFFEGGIELATDDLVIDGQNHTLDGKNLSRIFLITGKNVTLKNIKFKQGHSFDNFEQSINSDGGAINNSSHSILTIVGCTFLNNKSERNGGAISGGCYIDNSILKDNTSKKKGGSIYFRFNSKSTIQNSTIDNNKSESNGGAICNEGELTIEYGTMNNNKSESNGGAICNEGELTIEYGTMNNNKSEGRGGGAIYNKGKLRVTDTTLRENTAKYDGGAIRNNGTMNIIESTLLENTAKYDGGAIQNIGTMNIIESTLKENTAEEYGGAIYNQGELTITDITLQENTAKKTGGAISNEVGLVMDDRLTKLFLIYGSPFKPVVNNKININNCRFLFNTPDDNNQRPKNGAFKGDFLHKDDYLFFIQTRHI